MDLKRIAGDPRTLINPVDLLVIGLMSLIALEMTMIGGMAAAKFNLWRATGSTTSTQIGETK